MRDTLRTIGQGIHFIGDGQTVIVNGNNAYRLDLETGALAVHEEPMIGNCLIQFGETPWCSDLVERYERMAGENIAECFTAVTNYICGDRNWEHEWDPYIIAALIVATIIQDCLPWRPMVGLTGKTDSGKTVLFERLLKLLGRLAMNVDIPTEAGLRQKLSETKLPTFIDEFDSCPPNQIVKILELLRTAGHGGTIVRGSQNHVAVEFHVRHIIWLAGIHLGMFREQDFNRFIRLNIPHLEVQLESGYEPPSEAELGEMRNDLVALSLRILPAVADLTNRLTEVPFVNMPHRMVQNFALPAAVYSIATNGGQADFDVAEQTLRGMLEDRELPEILVTGTGQDLLTDILYTKVKAGYSGEKFVKELIDEISSRCGMEVNYPQELVAYGLRIFTPQGSEEAALFIAPKLVTKYLLQETPWAKMELDPIFRQIPGMIRTQQRMSTNNSTQTTNRLRGYAIPLSSLPGQECESSENMEECNSDE